jgi:hypothetical protein
VHEQAGPSNFANQTVPWIVDAARQLRGHPLWAKARVIYMTNYGYPLNNRHPGFRSEFGARAVDQALGPKLQELGVEVCVWLASCILHIKSHAQGEYDYGTT